MRVCEISHTVPPEVFIRRHVEAMRRYSAVDVILVGRSPATQPQASLADKPVAGELLMPNYDHLSLPAKVWNLRYALVGNSWRLRRPLRDRAVLGFFDRLQPDLIHFHMAGLAILMRWIPEALGIPYTLSLRGSDIQVEPLMSAQYAEAVKEAIEGAAAVHTVCDAIQQTARDLGVRSERMQTIYTTVPVPAALPEYSAGEGELMLLAAGRFHWRKGFPNLLKAFRLLLDMGIGAQLILVGAGPERDRVSYWINELDLHARVRLVGKLPPEEINRLLRRAHAFVQSSVAEGLSNSLAEAMAAGRPVFATDVGGTPEIVHDGVNGFLLPWDEPESWGQQLAMARERELMRQVGERAWCTAKGIFAAELHAERFSRFYYEAANAGSQRTPGASIGESLEGATARDGPPSLRDGDIVICSAWEWPCRLDEILLAIGRNNHRSRVVLAGFGSQEPEIRYLVHKLQLGSHVDLIKSQPSEAKMRLSRDRTEFRRVLFVEGAGRAGMWRVSRGECNREVPIEQLIALLRGDSHL